MLMINESECDCALGLGHRVNVIINDQGLKIDG